MGVESAVAAGYISKGIMEWAIKKPAFIVDWLDFNKDENGQWDFGAKANDDVYFPLSDSWRKADERKADCTDRVIHYCTSYIHDIIMIADNPIDFLSSDRWLRDIGGYNILVDKGSIVICLFW